MGRIAFSTILLGSSLVASPLVGQAQLKSSIGAYSAYTWRGLTVTNRPVLQPGLTVVVPTGRVELSLSGWANVEPGRYDGARDLSQGGGASSFDVTEFDWTAEAAYGTDRMTFAGGLIGYVFPNPSGVSPVFNGSLNTLEVYTRVGFKTRLSPTLGVYYDVRKIKGAYLEATVSENIAVSPSRSIAVGLLAAASAGQDADLDATGQPTAAFYSFARDGLTFVDLSAATTLTVGSVGVTPAVHFVYGSDPYAKLTSVGRENSFKVWLGASMSWARLFRGQPERVAANESEDR